LGIGIALAGYFIGDGLRNFGKQKFIDKYTDEITEEAIRKSSKEDK
jgi:hypothetical protein